MFPGFRRLTRAGAQAAAGLAMLWPGVSPLPAMAEDTCAHSLPPLSQDFTPGGPVPPAIPGRVIHMPHVLRDEFLVASWLQGFYNAVPGYDRGLNWGGPEALRGGDVTGTLQAMADVAEFFDFSRPLETDTLILSKYFVDVLRQQKQVEAAIQIAKNEARNHAMTLKNRLACGQSGDYSYRGREIVMGDDYSFSVHLAIGSFSVFWDATCRVGPKRCCIPDAGSESGFRDEAEFHCDIDFTLYDNYNFSVRSGTGGTGLLKAINPLGWFGTSFHQYGRWRQGVDGRLTHAMSQTAAACCRRPAADPPPPPPPPPQPPDPPPVQPPPGDGPAPAGEAPCPECDPIAAQIAAAEQSLADAEARVAALRQAAEDNRRKRAAEEARLKDLQREQDKGEWTASGSDPETGISKDYDATRGDGQVHVTVRNAKGEVIDSYSYPRSRNASEIRSRIEAAQKTLADLRAEGARLDEQLGNALKEQRRLSAELRRLRAELEACLKRCRGGGKDGGGTGALPGGGCSFPPAKPAILGPRDQFGYGGEQKAAEVGKAALGLLGGLLGGRGGGRGGGPLGGGSDDGKPPLADDPVRDKRLFTDADTGTAIKVGGLTRPDGKLLVSIDVNKAEDKGVVHYATLERLEPQADGSCRLRVAEPVEWQHYEIWEDWWAKIRIRRYESVNGGPWRQTHDTGWVDWGSGSRLLESGLLAPDQIPRTAWGSMGADRAFGGPRSAGAVFDLGRIAEVTPGTAERLVVHVTRPGQDPVSTVPFVLYPVKGDGGRVGYRDTPVPPSEGPR
ncbi:MAG: hypothetical protein JNM32_12305 [Dechloromonas sp.]|nr:hypothetical protein [Dechloromonas sp.]